MLRSLTLALLMAIGVVGPAAAQATYPPANPPDSQSQVEQLTREAIDKLMQAMSLVLQSIPQYETPELLPNGDIIIRRKNPPKPQTPPRGDRT